MATNLDGQLVVAISSRALFDLEEENRVFEQSDDHAYMQLQLQRLDEPAKPGVAFSLVKKLLAFNSPDSQRVEVVILSRNDPVSGLRVFRSVQSHALSVARGVFTRGREPWRYLSPLQANLFLSANPDDVKAALLKGFPAATVATHSVRARDNYPNEVRIAFDGDAVLFSDEAEQVYQRDGLPAFQQHESDKAVLPLPDGGTVQMHGQLDRIDVRHERSAGDVGHDVRWVLDYKTGNADTLRQRAQSGSEDTQLAFYAALGADPASSDDDAIRAGYVHLDPKGVKVLSHDAVADSAEVLMQGLASDWQRLRDGSPLPALGEGAVCGYCHARGLCRRDHWAAAPSPSEGTSA